ncbi:hypothetical protein QN277_009876 [Acacia crassicarpa]|uniref:Uncharacterized protein n=1 Tax=Acacia crassicarpa TaxID=499986 RepID=A0AAE1M7B1_9FABA|nr:hypothetical protein QN277_009876 [Acacia crassicarpa]
MATPLSQSEIAATTSPSKNPSLIPRSTHLPSNLMITATHANASITNSTISTSLPYSLSHSSQPVIDNNHHQPPFIFNHSTPFFNPHTVDQPHSFPSLSSGLNSTPPPSHLVTSHQPLPPLSHLAAGPHSHQASSSPLVGQYNPSSSQPPHSSPSVLPPLTSATPISTYIPPYTPSPLHNQKQALQFPSGYSFVPHSPQVTSRSTPLLSSLNQGNPVKLDGDNFLT